MIELVVTQEQCSSLELFCSDSFGASISALLKAYPPSLDICRYWIQKNGETITAALCKNGDEIILCDSGADFDEISEFLRVVGFFGLLCKKSSAESMKFEISSSGAIMQRNSCAEKNIFERPQNTSDFHEIFTLLNLYGDFAPWFADISHRIRKCVADMRIIRQNGRIVSTACAVSITENARIIGAVATAEEYRNRGFASHIADVLAVGNTYLRCTQQLVGFYERLGFSAVGEWAQI